MLIGTHHLYAHLHEPIYQQAIHWLQQVYLQFGLVAGICSGSLLAAKAGLLRGKRCTTHHNLISHLRTLEPVMYRKTVFLSRISKYGPVRVLQPAWTCACTWSPYAGGIHWPEYWHVIWCYINGAPAMKHS